MSVPNRFPTQPSSLRLAVIGEAPGADEDLKGEPFCGASGRFLAALLSKAGTTRDATFLGNICQYRPPGNDLTKFPWEEFQIQQGLEALRKDLEAFRPNMVVLLGNVPLKAAKDPGPWTKTFRYKASQWRGSLFAGQGVFSEIKCLATYHPAYCLRDYDATPLLALDLKKAVLEARSPELTLPRREFVIPTTADEACAALEQLQRSRRLVALDIEGYLSQVSCISFCNDPVVALVIPFFRRDYSAWWTLPEEVRVWKAVTSLLEDPLVPKCLQNSLYDRFVLHYSYGIRTRNVTEDTMLKHWELNSELEKNLGLQASIYTNEPYYKGDRKTQDDRTFFEYCGRDSAVTLEIAQKLDSCLTVPCSKFHYQTNVSLLEPLLYMELRGIRYDVVGAKARRDALRTQLFEAQARLNALTGRGFAWTSLSEIRDRVRSLMLTKKGDRTRKEYEEAHLRISQILVNPSPNLATIGEAEDLCEVSLNLGAAETLCEFLYSELGLPPQFNETKGKEPSRTADYEALLRLSRHCKQADAKHEGNVINACIEIRALETRQRMLGISADQDGRIRCGYNIVGSNTGRITCYESPTGSGYNLQTIPNYTNPSDAPGGVLGDRDLFIADPGHWFFQCDLKGADGWTVAAYCAMLGDRTMLEDYLFGLKPYQILACKLRGYEGEYRDRDWLKTQCRRIEKDAWDSFAAKRVQHGGAYLEGNITISRNILKDSEGKLYLPPNECGLIKTFFMQRYWGIPKWHEWVARQLRARPVLCAASGQVRQFNGRPDEILTKAVAFEPQANTTYATNLAMFRLWNDSENQLPASPGVLKIEPLHQVHDALCGQFHKTDTAWAIARIKSYFDNPLQIAGQRINIPFDGSYGESWGNLKEGTI